ncbi:M23 family metallopeptidase [Massilia arenosa]|uniref:M23 family metallopeptidase n=1 Tax=Zemynaea arenosa TaxID=2561931 RepID=A0A4Y9S7X5_9BURK|nr:M23 family metallopeptidase [Massilia arenosa]TFW16183.1 M23 family metallopeptidase [Massilia arenosa]
MNPTKQNTGVSWFSLLGSTRKARIVSASAIALAACAFGAAGVAPLAPDPADLPVRSIAQELQLPDIADQITALQNTDQSFIHEERVRPGDSLASLLNRLDVDDPDAVAFIKADKLARGVMQLKTGKRVQAQTDADGTLQWLRATVVEGKDTLKNITITRQNGKLVAQEAPVQLERRIEMRAREISSSLYAATDADVDGGRMPDQITAQLIEMFSTNIDFRSDLKRGDHFNVVYETFWQDGELVKTGRILAGEFTNRGVTYQSVWFDDPVTHQGGYYSFDGKALKKAFLKSPLEFSRISSGFSMRVHPVLGEWKQHKGIDFAAALGTPIRASGDGTVDFQGVSSGYGNMVVLKHWNNYSTAYAHMSRFAPGVRRGTKVHQGDIIGYVGATGWATGPHLHYEFRIGGTAVNPATVNVAQQAPLSPAELQRFRMVSADMLHRFDLLRPINAPRVALR